MIQEINAAIELGSVVFNIGLILLAGWLFATVWDTIATDPLAFNIPDPPGQDDGYPDGQAQENSMCEFCFFNGTTYLYVSNQRIMHLCSRCYNGKHLGKVRVKRIKVVHAKHPELRGAVQ